MMAYSMDRAKERLMVSCLDCKKGQLTVGSTETQSESLKENSTDNLKE